LKEWGVECNVTIASMTKLLKLLNVYQFPHELPIDGRSVFATKTSSPTVVEMVIKDKLLYLGIEQSLEKVVEMCGGD
jgi:predicted glycosyltransferase